MPYESKAQQRALHAKAARGEISKKIVEEFDRATKRKPGGFLSLPEKKAATLRALSHCGDDVLTALLSPHVR